MIEKNKVLILFTSTTCSKCPAAKNLVKVHNLDCFIMEVGTDKEAMEMAGKCNIKSVPQFVEYNQITSECNFISLDSEDEFNSMKDKYKL